MKTSKYNLITFLPRNLLEQFTRVANTYFLILVLVQLIPDVVPAIPPVSSVSAATTIIPLVFVLGVTAVKDAFDDIVRPCMGHLITQAYDILTHTYTGNVVPSYYCEGSIDSVLAPILCHVLCMGGSGPVCLSDCLFVLSVSIMTVSVCAMYVRMSVCV